MTNTNAPRYDLAVAYRICSKVSQSASPFGEDKRILAETCLRTFRDSLGSIRARMWVILDSCPPDFEEMFRRYFDERDLQFLRVENAGNAGTFRMQIDTLAEQRDAELIYFAEDDYLYLAGEFRGMLDVLRSFDNVDFVSPYDHPDFYDLGLESRRCELRFAEGRHWRTAGSTCLTFLTTRKTLLETRRVFESYSRRNFDSSIWLSLTKSRVRNPLAVARFALSDRVLFKVIGKAWLFCWRQILFGKRRKIWVPIPTIGTHLDHRRMAEGVSWSSMLGGEAGDAVGAGGRKVSGESSGR